MKSPIDKKIHSLTTRLTKIRNGLVALNEQNEAILQELETIKKIASEKTGVEAQKQSLAVASFSKRRGYKTN